MASAKDDALETLHAAPGSERENIIIKKNVSLKKNNSIMNKKYFLLSDICSENNLAIIPVNTITFAVPRINILLLMV